MPSNVARFEQLMYLSLGFGVIISALTWSHNVLTAAPLGGTSLLLFVQGGEFAVMVLLIWLVARRRKNWARWLLLIVLAILRLPAYAPVLRAVFSINPIAGVLGIARDLAQVTAFLLIFTGNSRDWFKMPAPASPS